MREYSYPPSGHVPCFSLTKILIRCPISPIDYLSSPHSLLVTSHQSWGLVLYYLNLPPIIYPNSTDKPSTSLNNYLSPLKRASVLRTDVLIYLRKEYLYTKEEIQTEDQRKDIWLLGIMLFLQKPFS